MSSKITNNFIAVFLTFCALLSSNQLFAQTPVVTTPVNYCKDVTASPLSATPSVGTSTLRWYTVPTGGTFSTTPITPATSTFGTTTYYVSEFDGVSEGPGLLSV